MAAVVEQFREALEIEGRYTSPYHPEANGKVERVNRTLKEYLRKMASNAMDWDVLLPWAMMAYNSAVHSSKGYSPFFIERGIKMRVPADIGIERRLDLDPFVRDIQNRVPRVWADVLRAMKTRSDTQLKEPLVSFEVGDQVWYFDPNAEAALGKMGIQWIGPVSVVRKLSDVVYELDIDTKYGKSNRLNVKNIRPYNPNTRVRISDESVPSLLIEPSSSQGKRRGVQVSPSSTEEAFHVFPCNPL
jgi:hypothetical protein